MDSIPAKRCSRCRQFKPATAEYFSKCKTGTLGLQGYCKVCVSEITPKSQKNIGVPQGYKRCTVCKEIKLATADFFRQTKKIKCGLEARCKECVNESERNNSKLIKCRKDWIEKNPDKVRKYSRDFQRKRRSNPEEYAMMLEQQRERRKANPKLFQEYSRQFRKKNPEKINAYNRKWYAEHREQGRISSLVRHHRRRGIKKHYHTGDDIINLYTQQKGKCWWCEKGLNNKFEIDHRIPVSKGGSNALNNIVLSCQFCNRSKYNHMPWEWSGRLL